MEKYVVTIGREFGSAGKEIGRELSWYLGVEYYDKTKISEMTEGFEEFNEEFNLVDESIALKTKLFSKKRSEKYDRMIKAQTEIIREIAERESCVIIGRCADYVLRDMPNVLNVFIYAPYENRIKRIMDLYGFTKAQAESSVKRIDQQRRDYYKYVTGEQRGDIHGKHILLDSSIFGVKGTADVLFDVASMKFGLDIPKKLDLE